MKMTDKLSPWPRRSEEAAARRLGGSTGARVLLAEEGGWKNVLRHM